MWAITEYHFPKLVMSGNSSQPWYAAANTSELQMGETAIFIAGIEKKK